MPLRKSTSHPDVSTLKNGPRDPSVKTIVGANALLSDAANDWKTDGTNGSLEPNTQQSRIQAMKSRSRSSSSSPRELVKLRTFRLDTLSAVIESTQLETLSNAQSAPLADPHLMSESPKLAFDDVEPRFLFNDSTSTEPMSNGQEIQRNSPSPLARSGTLSPADGRQSESLPWSSAVGHASTGKSGRVIERLQAEIDKLNRDKHFIKAQIEDAEKTKEASQTQITYLKDRNSNLEQSHEADLRSMKRKDRKIEELRADLQKEKLRLLNAEDTATEAMRSEEIAQDSAKKAAVLARQREQEYEAIKGVRAREQKQYQNQVTKLGADFSRLLQDRKEDEQKLNRLSILVEQQKHIISQLQEENRQTDNNFKEYSKRVDSLLTELRATFGVNDQHISNVLGESREVLGQMKWVMNVQRDVQGGV